MSVETTGAEGVDASSLCLACGLCCNGVLFEAVDLQPTDSAAQLERLGFTVKNKPKAPCFDQPCHALRNRMCHVYEQRPARCRQFTCLLLDNCLAGKVTPAEAQEQIAEAHRRVDVLRELLVELEDYSAHLPLMARYRNARARRIASWSHPEQRRWSKQLRPVMTALQEHLDAHFRPPHKRVLESA